MLPSTRVNLTTINRMDCVHGLPAGISCAADSTLPRVSSLFVHIATCARGFTGDDVLAVLPVFSGAATARTHDLLTAAQRPGLAAGPLSVCRYTVLLFGRQEVDGAVSS